MGLRDDQLDERTAKDKHMRASISTASGREFFPLSPNPADIVIEDIAHALANKCRFTGHSQQFYSVAQHSVLVSRYLEDSGFHHLALAGLMHDASEAYLPDVASPIKPHIPGFREMEDKLAEAIFLKFGLPWPMAHEIKVADAEIFKAERECIMRPCTWWRALPSAQPAPTEIPYQSPLTAWVLFVNRWVDLTGEKMPDFLMRGLTA